MERDMNDILDDINLAEQRRHRDIGFKHGYLVGEETGWRDGYIFGLKKGAQLSSEIGYYQGYARAWINLLEHDDMHKQRKLEALHTLITMVDAFPKTNLINEDTVHRIARIRAKFRQTNALLSGTKIYDTSSTQPSSHHFHGPSWHQQQSQYRESSGFGSSLNRSSTPHSASSFGGGGGGGFFGKSEMSF